MPLIFGLFLFKLTGGGRQQSRESCPLNITEHAGSCCVLHPGRGCPVWRGNPWVVTVVTVYDIGTDPWCIFKEKEYVGRSAESIFCIKQILTANNNYCIWSENNCWIHLIVNLHKFIVYLLPGRVDPPWWGSGGVGKQQGEACVVVCWCGCTVWTHLKEPVGDVGRKSDDGSSHPGPGNWTVQVCLVSPNGVSLVGWNITQENKENCQYSS